MTPQSVNNQPPTAGLSLPFPQLPYKQILTSLAAFLMPDIGLSTVDGGDKFGGCLNEHPRAHASSANA
jgi:hypothetical protein